MTWVDDAGRCGGAYEPDYDGPTLAEAEADEAWLARPNLCAAPPAATEHPEATAA